MSPLRNNTTVMELDYCKYKDCNEGLYCDPGIYECTPCEWICDGKHKQMCDDFCNGGGWPPPDQLADSPEPVPTTQASTNDNVIAIGVIVTVLTGVVAIGVVLTVFVYVKLSRKSSRKTSRSSFSSDASSDTNQNSTNPLIETKQCPNMTSAASDVKCYPPPTTITSNGIRPEGGIRPESGNSRPDSSTIQNMITLNIGHDRKAYDGEQSLSNGMTSQQAVCTCGTAAKTTGSVTQNRHVAFDVSGGEQQTPADVRAPDKLSNYDYNV